MEGHDAELILVVGALLAAGIAAALAADRVRVPGLLLFLGLGMLVGSEGIGGIEFDDARAAQTAGTIGLVLILFEGGLTAGWHEIRPVLRTAVALATGGTFLTALVAGLAAVWIFDLSTLQGLILGAAIAATDSAAIFAVLRGSRLERRLARTLEGESGMNDPVALLLVIGFGEWIADPSYGAADMALEFVVKMGLGAALGIAAGWIAKRAIAWVDLPTQGLYPVATLATAAISYGVAEVAGGSGFLAVYVAALVLGTGSLPARSTVVSFHQGLSWLVQIGLFFLLGLLVFPSQLWSIAGEGLLLSVVLIFVARPLATLLVTQFGGLNIRERTMLGWAGLRGAIPIWLATFPVVAGVAEANLIFTAVFFVVVTSTLIQGVTVEPLAKLLGVTSTERALPVPVADVGMVRELGAELISWRVRKDDAAAGLLIRELELPREALVHLIVRDGRALAPRGSTRIEPGDELHLLVQEAQREEVEQLTQRWREGPLGSPAPLLLPPRGSPQVFSVRPGHTLDGDPALPEQVDGIEVRARLRTRRDEPGALVALADGRFAVTTEAALALGSRRALAEWCGRRALRRGIDEAERSWWQEAAGTLVVPVGRPES
ncbi:MAG TPA: potassium/proton antiporter [Solirubrobacterales bacterium]|nr:potassium/proton antiporter [Solirubrobacterales bacterium]